MSSQLMSCPSSNSHSEVVTNPSAAAEAKTNSPSKSKLSIAECSEIIELMKQEPKLQQLIERHSIHLYPSSRGQGDHQIVVKFTTEVKQPDGTIERYTRFRAAELFEPFSTFFCSALQQKQLNDVNPLAHIAIGIGQPKQPE